MFCGKVKRNEATEFVVENGLHTIYAKERFGWGRSRNLDVNIDNSRVYLEVGRTPSNADAGGGDEGIDLLFGIIFLIISIFRRNDALYLEYLHYIEKEKRQRTTSRKM